MDYLKKKLELVSLCISGFLLGNFDKIFINDTVWRNILKLPNSLISIFFSFIDFIGILGVLISFIAIIMLIIESLKGWKKL